MNRCWPLSTVSPVLGSLNEYARPPRCGFFSSTTTRAPRSASAAAQDRPANPPPSTTTSEDPIRERHAAQREPGLAPRREPRLLEKHAVIGGLELVEHALVD